MTELDGPALLLTVYVGEDDVHHHRPVYAEIVSRARAAGLAGATVVRGLEGYGRSSVVHTSRLVSLSGDLPMVVQVVDTEERIRAFLPDVDELVHGGLVTLTHVQVHRYVSPPTSGA
jgi:PII-like signaling protein